MSQLSCSGFLWFCASYRVAIECCSAVAALQAEVVGDLHIRVHPLHKDVPPGGKHLLALGRQDGLAGQSRSNIKDLLFNIITHSDTNDALQ